MPYMNSYVGSKGVLCTHPMSIILKPVELLELNFILCNRYFWVNKEPSSEKTCLATLVYICGTAFAAVQHCATGSEAFRK